MCASNALKAIQTRYNGCRFRSRAEARWAVFFDALGIRWQYEAEGFDLDGMWYLPDFWLPEFRMWWEVKGECPVDGSMVKAASLARESGSVVVVAWGLDQEDNVYFWQDKRKLLWCAEGFTFDEFHGASFTIEQLQAAIEAARSARFEHGEFPHRS